MEVGEMLQEGMDLHQFSLAHRQRWEWQELEL